MHFAQALSVRKDLTVRSAAVLLLSALHPWLESSVPGALRSVDCAGSASLARLRDSEQSNHRIHYSSGRRSSRTFQGFDDYRVLPRDPGALDRLWQLLRGGTYNSGYYLKPLEDGTYLCLYLDDCAFLFGEPEELYTGRLRSVDAPEEAQMLSGLQGVYKDEDETGTGQ